MAAIVGRNVGIQGRGVELVIVSLVFVSVALCLVLGRLWSRMAAKRSFGLDDYAITLSLVSGWEFCYTRLSLAEEE